MKLLKDRILKYGIVKPGNILKVDSFLNHQMDITLSLIHILLKVTVYPVLLQTRFSLIISYCLTNSNFTA